MSVFILIPHRSTQQAEKQKRTGLGFGCHVDFEGHLFPMTTNWCVGSGQTTDRDVFPFESPPDTPLNIYYVNRNRIASNDDGMAVREQGDLRRSYPHAAVSSERLTIYLSVTEFYIVGT